MERKSLRELFAEAGLPENGPYTDEQKEIGRKIRWEFMTTEYEDFNMKKPTCCEDCPFREPDFKGDDGEVLIFGAWKGICDVFGDHKPDKYTEYGAMCPYYAGEKYKALLQSGQAYLPSAGRK